jgi:hypothetical protein
MREGPFQALAIEAQQPFAARTANATTIAIDGNDPRRPGAAASR